MSGVPVSQKERESERERERGRDGERERERFRDEVCSERAKCGAEGPYGGHKGAQPPYQAERYQA